MQVDQISGLIIVTNDEICCDELINNIIVKYGIDIKLVMLQSMKDKFNLQYFRTKKQGVNKNIIKL